MAVRTSAPDARALESKIDPGFAFVQQPESEISNAAVRFRDALAFEMARHGDSYTSLHQALTREGTKNGRQTLKGWLSGTYLPRFVRSFETLALIEKRYKLPAGYFQAALANGPPLRSETEIKNAGPEEAAILRWHLPKDFDARPTQEQDEILNWIRKNVCFGVTVYGRFVSNKKKDRFSIRFSELLRVNRRSLRLGEDDMELGRRPAGAIDAPARLTKEMADFACFKSSTFTERGLFRASRWRDSTTEGKLRTFGWLFGILSAPKRSHVLGLEIPVRHLSFALLAFPKVMDGFLASRREWRGFFTVTETSVLMDIKSMTRRKTGWLRQRRYLSHHLQPVPGLLSKREIMAARRNWPATCDRAWAHAKQRMFDLQQVTQRHRDPFEPLLAVLDAKSPLSEYRKITDEILRRMPDEREDPLGAAETIRTYLIVRLGMHLGIRARNLRELRFCPKDGVPRTERLLQKLRGAELRWQKKTKEWEVFAPVDAFKNEFSSFFSNQPFRLTLPNLADLYEIIDAYLDQHRAVLFQNYRGAPAADEGFLFVRTATQRNAARAFSDSAFYLHWRHAIERYGIYNPYTKLGAIPGLLPHGPHAVRDVLATHILKLTGSYELASYAIQNTPRMIAKHYGRFLPFDKSAQAAEVLNQVWKEATDQLNLDYAAFQSGDARSPEWLGWRQYHRHRRSVFLETRKPALGS